MELYIHLPFCRSKCRYCDFPSFAGCEKHFAAYVDALLNEAHTEASVPVETVFIGGGTPSILPAPLMAKLLLGLREHFDFAADVEFTSEANPGTLTQAWLDAAVSGGVNRLSLGMQAYQPRLLRTLGRIHDFEHVKDSVAMARSAGIRNINLDLMFGLPGQTPADWLETLEAALSLQPEHLSCYGLIPEDGTPLTADLEAGRLTLPDEADERVMYDDTLRILAQHGYQQYEISNFAKPGYACRHNLGYWRQVPYLGLGASASSMLPDPNGSAAYLRRTNPPSPTDYLAMMESHDFSRRETLTISREEAMFETLMLGLRTTAGVAEADFLAMHGEPITHRYGNTLEKLRAQGLLEHRDGRWYLTRRGMDVQNAVLVELM